jgi:methionyl-tRNA formyltransferase
MSDLRVIFAGSGEFGLPTLRMLVQSGHSVVQVVTQPDRPAGRGRKVTPTPIAAWVEQQRQLGLSIIRTESINEEALTAADVMVVVAFGQKIGEQIVHHSRLGSINLHASLLPRYRGAAPINWAILRGETVTGNSVIRLAPKMDAGAILAQSQVAIGELETAGELHDRLAADGAPLVLRVLDELAGGRSSELPQDEAQATLAPKLSRESAILDWSRAPEELCNHIRGLYPWPGCRSRLVDAGGKELGRLTLVRARPARGEGPRWRPGEIMSDGAISVGAGSGAVELIECQPEGKRPMALHDFRNGHPWMPGMRLESIT